MEKSQNVETKSAFTPKKRDEYLLENITDDMAQQEVWKIKFDTYIIIYGIDLFFIFFIFIL